MKLLLQTDSVQKVKGIGPKMAGRLALLGITTVGDLLYHLPRAYRDYSEIFPIAALRNDMDVTISGRVVNITERRPRARLSILSVTVEDASGVMELIYFNQPYRKNKFYKGMPLLAHGRVKLAYGRWQMNNAEVEFLAPGETPEGTLKPVYPLTDGIRANALAEWIATALRETTDITDTLPREVRQRRGYGARREALYAVHLPESQDAFKSIREELAFDELFYMQLGILRMRKKRETSAIGIKCAPNGRLFTSLYNHLPYRLTNDQEKALVDICDDMEGMHPMRRLVQGDVGSGKTVVAALAMAKAVENGYQAVMMAPTEILAIQHEESLRELFADTPIRLGCLTGRMTATEKEKLLNLLANGEIDVVVGTHALIEENVDFSALGLVITDEQHRFGVRQRMILERKGTEQPHTLVMTATPIPRTMALSVYGDLDVSLIREMPPGRKPVKTYAVKRNQQKKVYRFLADEMTKGHQIYVVCPLVEESVKLDAKAAVQVYEEMSRHFSEFGVGLVYGSMKSGEKQEAMEAFASAKIHMLVATSVVEVGVNVPNATVMYIDGAERFGLSQLHQLRGRVGRGEAQSYCILMSDSRNETAQLRLKLMETIQDGFELAEKDLLMRGAGELFGYRQHGLPDLKVADLVRDLPLLLEAREEAARYVDADDPLLDAELQRRFGEKYLEVLYH